MSDSLFTIPNKPYNFVTLPDYDCCVDVNLSIPKGHVPE